MVYWCLAGAFSRAGALGPPVTTTATQGHIATCAPRKRGMGAFSSSKGRTAPGLRSLERAVVAQPRADLHRADRHSKRLAACCNLLGSALKRRAARLRSLRLPHKALHVGKLPKCNYAHKSHQADSQAGWPSATSQCSCRGRCARTARQARATRAASTQGPPQPQTSGQDEESVSRSAQALRCRARAADGCSRAAAITHHNRTAKQIRLTGVLRPEYTVWY